MKEKYQIVDYRKFRFHKLKNEFSYLLLLLFWPIFGVLFYYVEQHYPVKQYDVLYHPIDDMIPFNELFVIPYLFWFVFLVGMHIYLLLFDVECFRKMEYYTIITYGIALIMFFVWPNSQELRPVTFERDNILTRFMADFYQFDTNTNVCPSLHVVGSWVVACASYHTKRFQTMGWRIFFTVSAVLISISTVFLKQHSIIDIVVAIPICVIAYILCYKVNWAKVPRRQKRAAIS